MFVITLVRINWKKESEKAMKCAEGSQQLETEQVIQDDETIQSELSQESREVLVMKEMDISETTLSEENIKHSEQGDLSHYICCKWC